MKLRTGFVAIAALWMMPWCLPAMAATLHVTDDADVSFNQPRRNAGGAKTRRSGAVVALPAPSTAATSISTVRSGRKPSTGVSCSVPGVGSGTTTRTLSPSSILSSITAGTSVSELTRPASGAVSFGLVDRTSGG